MMNVNCRVLVVVTVVFRTPREYEEFYEPREDCRNYRKKNLRRHLALGKNRLNNGRTDSPGKFLYICITGQMLAKYMRRKSTLRREAARNSAINDDPPSISYYADLRSINSFWRM